MFLGAARRWQTRWVRRASGNTRLTGMALAVLLALLAACSPPPPEAAPVVADPVAWAARVQASLDDVTLDGGGLQIPDGGNVLAVQIFGGGSSPAYAFYEAGGGAFADDFFPASSIKLLAALGALDLARSLGFTGNAVVDGGFTIHDYYDAALRYSSNEDYSELVRIAGVDRLNQQFLPDHGFLGTTIQEAYGAGEQVLYSPEMVLTEGDREVTVAEREGEYNEACGSGNCSTLFDLLDATRRVMLDAEIPAGERFDLSPDDIAGLQDALAGAEGFIAPGVAEALGPDALIFTKPGWVPYLACVEAALIVDPTTGRRYLIGLSAPDDGTCEELATMARDVLQILAACDPSVAVRADGSRVSITDGRQSGTPLPEAGAGLPCHLR